MNQFCDKCGTQINQTTGTCPNCAPNQVAVNGGAQTKAKKPMNKKAIILGAVAIVVVFSIVLGIGGILGYVIGKSGNNLPDSYNEIVERYKLVMAGEEDDEKTLSNKLIDKFKGSENYEICYSLTDINDDDVDELIVGGRFEDDKTAETCDIYTMDAAGKAEQVFDVNSFSENTEITIYNEVIKVTEKDDDYLRFTYNVLPEKECIVKVDEEYYKENDKYYEVIHNETTADEKNEISEETFEEADKKHEGKELDLEWVKVVLEEDDKEKETTETNINNEDIYTELLNMYYTSISCNWSNLDGEFESVYDPDSACFLFHHNLEEHSLDDIGYILIDIDDNGQSELIVSPIFDSGTSTIYDMYTVVDDEIVRVINAVERDAYYLTVDNTINNYSSGGAMLTSRINYYLEGSTGKLRVKEVVLYDGYSDPDNPWFYATTEYYDMETYEQIPGVLKPISETEAKNIEDSFPEQKLMELTPFSKYKVQ